MFSEYDHVVYREMVISQDDVLVNKILGLYNALNMGLTLFSLKSLQVLLMTSSGRRVVIFAVSAF